MTHALPGKMTHPLSGETDQDARLCSEIVLQVLYGGLLLLIRSLQLLMLMMGLG
jgi:hypothetical protein